MQIPRDVLIAGARAYWLHLGQKPEVAERMAADWVDEGGDCIVIMVAAIEAWENRPHPWGEPPATGTDDDADCGCPDLWHLDNEECNYGRGET